MADRKSEIERLEKEIGETKAKLEASVREIADSKVSLSFMLAHFLA